MGQTTGLNAVLVSSRHFDLIEVSLGRPPQHGVLLEIRGCGVCSGDLDRWQQGGEPLPVRLGHEVEGVVVDVAPGGRHELLGERVAAWVTGGGYATHVYAEGEHLVPLPAGVNGFTLEPLSCCLQMARLVPHQSRVLAVVGSGYMARLLIQILALTSLDQIYWIGRTATHGAMSAGSTVSCLTSEEAREQLSSQCDAVVELTGTQSGLDDSFALLRSQGTLVIAGYHQAPRLVPMGQWNYAAIDVRNAHFRDVTELVRCMRWGARLLAAGAVSDEGLVTDVFGLSELDCAFRTLHSTTGTYRKGLLSLLS